MDLKKFVTRLKFIQCTCLFLVSFENCSFLCCALQSKLYDETIKLNLYVVAKSVAFYNSNKNECVWWVCVEKKICTAWQKMKGVIFGMPVRLPACRFICYPMDLSASFTTYLCLLIKFHKHSFIHVVYLWYVHMFECTNIFSCIFFLQPYWNAYLLCMCVVHIVYTSSIQIYM